MARLRWDDLGDRFYDIGLDRGVLFIGDRAGVSWPGLVSVSEDPDGGEAQPFYLDGVKYSNISTAEEFAATITAVSHPPEFYPCDGLVSPGLGLLFGQQKRVPFGFSYRTHMGNAQGEMEDYKLHLVYNALAEASSKSSSTISDNIDVDTMSWKIKTRAVSMVGYAPVGHLMVDTRLIQDYINPENDQLFTKAQIIDNLESHLYGDEVYAAMLPNPDQLQTILTGQMLDRDLV